MIPPAFQAAGAAGSSLADLFPAWPSHLSNDVALMLAESSNETAALNSTGWAEVTSSPQGVGPPSGTTSTRLTLWWRRAGSSGMGPAWILDPGDHVVGQILTFRGCVTSGNPYDVTAGSVETTTTSAVTIPGASTSTDNCLVVTLVCHGTDIFDSAQVAGWSNPDLTNLVEITDYCDSTGTANGGGFAAAAGVKTVAGAYSATTATLANASSQGRISLALIGIGQNPPQWVQPSWAQTSRSYPPRVRDDMWVQPGSARNTDPATDTVEG